MMALGNEMSRYSLLQCVVVAARAMVANGMTVTDDLRAALDALEWRDWASEGDGPSSRAIDVEELSARFHDIYQKEAHRRGDVRHADAYADLSDATKEWDRVLARWVIAHFVPAFDPKEGVPSA